jgi:hypothetical protein
MTFIFSSLGLSSDTAARLLVAWLTCPSFSSLCSSELMHTTEESSAVTEGEVVILLL